MYLTKRCLISTFLVLGIIGVVSAQPQTWQSAAPSAAQRQVAGARNDVDAKSVTFTSDAG